MDVRLWAEQTGVEAEARGADVATTTSAAALVAFIVAGGDDAAAGVETHRAAACAGAADNVADGVAGCVAVETICIAAGVETECVHGTRGFARQQRLAHMVTALLQHDKDPHKRTGGDKAGARGVQPTIFQ